MVSRLLRIKLLAVICGLQCSSITCLVTSIPKLQTFSPKTSNVTRRPNILLLFPDQWRYDWDGVPRAGGPEIPLRMPTVQAMVKRGLRFTQAYTPSPLCAPSRSCLASGREFDLTGVARNEDDFPWAKHTTFYSLLQGAGYHTMSIGKDDLTKGSQLGFMIQYKHCDKCLDGDSGYLLGELGLSDGHRCAGKEDLLKLNKPHDPYGFFLNNHTVTTKTGESITAWEAYYACYKGRIRKDGKPIDSHCDSQTFLAELYQDDWIAKFAIDALRRRPQDKPFFLQVNFAGPHDPFLITGKMLASVSDGRVWPDPVDAGASGASPGGSCSKVGGPSVARNRCNYAAELEHLDQLFQNILDEVTAQGEKERTVVFISSDHGEMLGDHGQDKKKMPWQGSLAVPLVMAGPGIPKNLEIDKPVSILDLAGTFLEIAGTSPAPGMTTRSLLGMYDDKQSGDLRHVVHSGWDNFRVVIKEIDGTSFKYICCRGECPGKPSTAPNVSASGWMQMLIDVNKDPFDMKDLSTKRPEVVAKLLQYLPTQAYGGVDYQAGCASITQVALAASDHAFARTRKRHVLRKSRRHVAPAP